MSIKELLRNLIPSRLLIRKLPKGASETVLLTFDDGPNVEVTPAVLDRLDRYGARAVFFLVGRRIAEAPELLREALERGHLLGNHSFQHANGRQPRFRAYLHDLGECQQAIRDCCGYETRLFRPPRGILSPTTIFAPWLAGLRTMTWSVDVQDWRCHEPREASDLGKRLGETVRGGDIVLLHDDNRCVLDLLDRFLPIAAERHIDLCGGLGMLPKIFFPGGVQGIRGRPTAVAAEESKPFASQHNRP
jgi:peptidoglycan/xylan/chitin deacetylase (PgdA/CDA1 family)